MKALTVWQPWASLIASGGKQYETRSWATRYRGLLAIHAGKRWKDDQIQVCFRQPLQKVLKGMGYERPKDLPRGKLVALTELVGVYPTDQKRGEAGEWEQAFGNWSTGRYAWDVRVKHVLDAPIPVGGHPGLWDVPTAIQKQIMEARRS